MPISLGAVTDEISINLEEALSWAKEKELDYIDLRDLWVAGENISELSEDKVNKAYELVKTSGLKVKTICPTLFRALLNGDDVKRLKENRSLVNTDDSQYAEHLRILKHSIDLADRFEAPFIRTFAFFREKEPDEVWKTLIEAFELPLEMVAERGKILLLENEDMSYAASGSEAARLLQKINNKHFRAIWDPANAYNHEEKPFPTGYNQIKPFIELIHAKDISGSDIVTMGNGEINWDGQLKALQADKFSGGISIETHTLSGEQNLLEGSEENLEYIRTRLTLN